jgi:hypothetical protein
MLGVLVLFGCGGGGGGTNTGPDHFPAVTIYVNGSPVTPEDYGLQGPHKFMKYLTVHDHDYIRVKVEEDVFITDYIGSVVCQNQTTTSDSWEATFLWNCITPGDLGSVTLDISTSGTQGAAPVLEIQFIVAQ